MATPASTTWEKTRSYLAKRANARSFRKGAGLLVTCLVFYPLLLILTLWCTILLLLAGETILAKPLTGWATGEVLSLIVILATPLLGWLLLRLNRGFSLLSARFWGVVFGTLLIMLLLVGFAYYRFMLERFPAHEPQPKGRSSGRVMHALNR